MDWQREKTASSFQKDYGPVCSDESASVSSSREQDRGTGNTPTAFVFISFFILHRVSWPLPISRLKAIFSIKCKASNLNLENQTNPK